MWVWVWRWGVISKVIDRRGIAAWTWLQAVGPARDGGNGLGIAAALWSRLIHTHMVFRPSGCGDGVAWACLGNYKWAVLAWELEPLPIPRDDHYRFRTDGGRATWHHIVDAVAWDVVSWEAVFVDGCGIVLKRTGVEALPKAVLRQSNRVGFDDLVRIGRFYGIEAPENLSRADLLVALADVVAADDENLRTLICNASQDMEPVDVLVDDPLFEATFEELGEDDKRELKLVKKGA